jgi:prepilin-type N-terminal cleavage/methylation domain-containing protein
MRKGFTLIELLVTTAIIGVLSSVSLVSYNYIRVKSRDTARVADIKTLRTAVESYFEFYSHYPAAGEHGLILGSPEAKSISEAGLTPAGQEVEPIFLLNVPANPEPGGVPFVYKTRNQDGSPCYGTDCGGYTISFDLESDLGDFKAGPHRLTETMLEGPEGNIKNFSAPDFLQQITPTAEDLQIAYGTLGQAATVAQSVTARPEVQAGAVVAWPVALASTGAGLASVLATVVPAANAWQFLFLLIIQPVVFVGRRKRETWGTVYNAATKVPVDLASVRLIDARTSRPMGAKVTDRDGRYAFTAPAGSYRLEVQKPGFSFPATSMSGVDDDGKFYGIYHGTLLEVPFGGGAVTANIPLDPTTGPMEEPKVLLSAANKRGVRRFLASFGPILGVLALVARPSLVTVALLGIQIAAFALFRRLSVTPEPKNQGIVYDEADKSPVAAAVIRIVSLPYNKVLETKLTDPSGRYSFYVGAGRYYLTIAKTGYDKTETEEIDLSTIDKPSFIAADIPMRRATPNSELS